MEKANQAYEEAAKAAELAVKKAQDAAAETQESGKGIWQKARALSLPASEFCFARTVTSKAASTSELILQMSRSAAMQH